jgi:hypothetical protein
MSWLDLKSKGMRNIPGIPEASNSEIIDTLWKLNGRDSEMRPAIEGLSRNYTIGGHTAKGRDFLFGDAQLRALSLDEPKQFTISWTNYKNVYQRAVEQSLDEWALELTIPTRANPWFWYHMSWYGTAYNLLILRRVTDNRLPALKALFAGHWTDHLESLQREGRLYEIDFSMFESIPRSYYHEGSEHLVRYNPATLTLLEMRDKYLTPAMIRLSSKGQETHIYAPNVSTDGAWLYALQAAKSSAMLYGIWLGHVYHWHIVTAAMVKTMRDTIPSSHPVSRLLAPQSDYLIGFDYVVLADSYFNIYDKIAPPTGLGAPLDVLHLLDMFAENRRFFDDDPRSELAKNGLEQASFTDKQPWDLYGVAYNLLQIWDVCERFVAVFVDQNYANDHAVAADAYLQKWMNASADPSQGNIRGLPGMNQKAALARVLTSLVYRITAHGVSRLPNTADPGLSFVPNFPPCLQRLDSPPPNSPLSTRDLLKHLPNTGTIGGMLKFYFAFAYSKPYVPLIPAGGLDQDLYFDGGSSNPCNAALIKFRKEMEDFMRDYNRIDQPFAPKVDVEQWPRNIET